MPHLPSVDAGDGGGCEPVFPPVTKDHIQNCSYDAWFPRYRSSCLKSRIVPLPQSAVSYLQEDGIVLADEDDDGNSRRPEEEEWHSSTAPLPRPDPDGSSDGSSEDDDGDDDDGPRPPPNKRFPETHELIRDKIAELGGAVAPKLNWSSPKDAKWISPHQNTLKCTSPKDVYLLLKSSSFVSHDLAYAFDGCTPAPPSRPFAPVLVLRPFFTPHTALEFRCFVKHRTLIGITQRDLNYYGFLRGLGPRILDRIRSFFREKLRLTFPDASFVFDVYLPEDPSADDGGGGLGRVRLIDINPWAPRTDTLLFSWRELLDMEVRAPLYGSTGADTGSEDTSAEELDGDSDVAPELRLMEKDDAAAYNFSSPQYSAHKLPKEVVDASMAGEGGLMEFARQWKDMMEGTRGRGGGMPSQPGEGSV